MDSKSLRSEFDAFDTDGNGVISKDEFMAVSMQSCYVQFKSDLRSSRLQGYTILLYRAQKKRDVLKQIAPV